ncbi:hypothetical protein [Streptomyces triticisoli]|jgi:hypothetical protein|uniref:hypothetical protein n=1 Tax=Streptomyces triticisoli TaxID=2182797 RepID=UPI0013006634|nr:hypothetical protein [Streptomyces triticisoli]
MVGSLMSTFSYQEAVGRAQAFDSGRRPDRGSAPDPDPRQVVWWRVPELRRMVRLPFLAAGIGLCLAGVLVKDLAIGGLLGKGSAGVNLALLLGALGFVGIWFSVCGLRVARGASRALRSGSSRSMRYVLLREPDSTYPFMLLFPEGGGEQAPPVSAVVLGERRLAALPEAVGTARLHQTSGESLYAVPWVVGRPYYPLDRMFPLDPDDPECARSLDRLVGMQPPEAR